MPKKICIAMVAGETSGDMLGGGLIDELNRRADCEIVGIGGANMRRQGCKILFDMDKINVIGLEGLISKLPDIIRIKRQLLTRFRRDKPDVFVGIDAPDFNLALAGKLKSQGIKCVQYVSPTVWAWRRYRMHKIRKSTDLMLVLFPFEVDFYRKHKIQVKCVGHPLADEITVVDKTQARKKIGITKLGLTENGLKNDLLIALLPGSRLPEVRRLSPVLIAAARRILIGYPNAKFVMPFADAKLHNEFMAVDSANCRIDKLPIHTITGNARLALAACDFAVLACGTAALEAALLRRPHIVVYKLAYISYWIMRRLRYVEFYSMPNQLLPKPIIPELIQNQASGENIAAAVDELIQNKTYRTKLENQFADMHHNLKRNANATAAEAILELVGDE